MDAGRIATVAVAVALAGLVWFPAIAEESDAEYSVVVWFYSEDGSALFFTRTATPGDTLAEVLNGSLTSYHWVDLATGYEYPKEKPITKDTMLRASTDVPPQEPVSEPADYSMLAVWLVLAGVVAFIGLNAVKTYRRH